MEINELILEGKSLDKLSEGSDLKKEYDNWCRKLKFYMKENGFSDKEQEEAKLKMHYIENEYSEIDSRMSIKKAIRDTVQFFEERLTDTRKNLIEPDALLLINRLLDNFFMYFVSMYRMPVHKKGTLTQDTLAAIQIGNEYDLQRMLYSLLLPVFPNTRQEVFSDNGYGGMRADIYLEELDLIIETKCTRDSMSEKKLIEELGADGFHYNAKNIYFFVFDKAAIIRNPTAFRNAFERNQKTDGKNVKVIIMQTVVF